MAVFKVLAVSQLLLVAAVIGQDRPVVPIGTTSYDLVASSEVCYAGECTMGDMITDAIVAAYSGKVIGLQNGGGLKTTISKGPILPGDMVKVMPYGDTFNQVGVTGAQLKQIFEHSAEEDPCGVRDGRFMQVSGATLTIDYSKPAGSRVSNLKVGSSAVDSAKTYSVVTNNYLTDLGGNGYTFPSGSVAGSLDVAVANDYVSKNSPLKPTSSNRITVLNKKC